MKRFLLFLNLLIIAMSHISAQDGTGHQMLNERYAFQLDTPKAALSGVMITREDSTRIIGSMINEFGISALDFIYTKCNGKVRLDNVVGFLDKWYIRRVLKADIGLCVRILAEIPYKKSKQYEISVTPSETKVTNTKRHITYTFSPFKCTANETE